MTPITERQRAGFTCGKSKIIPKRLYIFTKQYTLQKSRHFALRFNTQKPRYFTLHDFHDFFENGINTYTKRMKLYVT